MQRSAYFSLISLIVLVAFEQPSSAQVTWQRITDHEAGIAVSFPGRPTYSESTATETGQPLETYSFYFNGITLHLAFGPITPAPRTAAEINKVLSDTADIYARNAGNLLRQEKLSGGGRQFDNVVKTPSGIVHMRSRVYVHRGMMFTLSCSSYAQDGIDERVAEQFFSSFSLIDDPPVGRATARRTSPSKTVPKVVTPSHWYTIRRQERDFVAEFPGKPNYSVDIGSGTALYQYRFAHGENFFSVSFRERYEPRASSEQELELALKNYNAALPGWDLLRQEKIPGGTSLNTVGCLPASPLLPVPSCTCAVHVSTSSWS